MDSFRYGVMREPAPHVHASPASSCANVGKVNGANLHSVPRRLSCVLLALHRRVLCISPLSGFYARTGCPTTRSSHTQETRIGFLCATAVPSPSFSHTLTYTPPRLLHPTFAHRKRTWVLFVLLLLQSLSGFVLQEFRDNILSGNAYALMSLFLTMLVGAGGNAGNQSAVFVIRNLATGAADKNVNPWGMVSREV